MSKLNLLPDERRKLLKRRRQLIKQLQQASGSYEQACNKELKSINAVLGIDHASDEGRSIVS